MKEKIKKIDSGYTVRRESTMINAKILCEQIVYFRSVQMLKNMFNWNEKAKLCDLMCCIAYVMLMEGEY